MKLRCRRCHGALGLGVKSKAIWEPTKWWYVVYRFCSQKCQDAYLLSRHQAQDRERAVHRLYHPP